MEVTAASNMALIGLSVECVDVGVIFGIGVCDFVYLMIASYEICFLGSYIGLLGSGRQLVPINCNPFILLGFGFYMKQ